MSSLRSAAVSTDDARPDGAGGMVSSSASLPGSFLLWNLWYAAASATDGIVSVSSPPPAAFRLAFVPTIEPASGIVSSLSSAGVSTDDARPDGAGGMVSSSASLPGPFLVWNL